MTTVHSEPESNDASIEELLREVGARHEPSSEAATDVISAVHAEWRAIVQRRRQYQRAMTCRVAASLTLAVLIAAFAYRFVAQPAQVASIVNVQGHLQAVIDDGAHESRAIGEFIKVRDIVQTDSQSRAALSFPDGLSLRLDHNTRLAITATDRIDLVSGAIYVDASPGKNSAEPLTVETSAGSVQHVGTQYQVRVHSDGMLVSIREGRVIVTSPTSANTGEAGQVLHLSADGSLTRSTLSPADPRWHWTLQAAPVFDIDNQPLAAFLQWIARETGRHLIYSTPQAEAAAAAVKLQGSIAGLDADAALAAVLSTTQLRRYQTDATALGIELTPIDSATPTRQTP